MRGADDDGVPRDHRRRMQADLACDEVHDLVVLQLQIDDPAPTEAGNRGARFCVERDQSVSGGDVQNSLLTAVGPVREPATRQLTRCRLTALALSLAVHPDQLTCEGVERGDGPSRAGRRISDATYHPRS